MALVKKIVTKLPRRWYRKGQLPARRGKFILIISGGICGEYPKYRKLGKTRAFFPFYGKDRPDIIEDMGGFTQSDLDAIEKLLS